MTRYLSKTARTNRRRVVANAEKITALLRDSEQDADAALEQLDLLAERFLKGVARARWAPDRCDFPHVWDFVGDFAIDDALDGNA